MFMLELICHHACIMWFCALECYFII